MNYLSTVKRAAIGLVLFGLVFALLRGPSASDVPEAKRNAKWKARVALLNERLETNGESAKVLFLGDSITQLWEAEGESTWSRLAGEWGAINLGVSGDCTQHLLWRIDNSPIEKAKPKAAVLLIGSNNIKAGHSAADTKRGVEAVLSDLQKKLPETKILLSAILPREDAPAWVIREANELLRPLADGQRIHWLDCGEDFLNRNGEIQKRFFKGKPAVHPSAAGYAILERCVRAAVEPLLQ